MEKKYTEEDFARLKESFQKVLEASAPCYAQTSFSEGHLAPDVKYKLLVSKPMNSRHLNILINKLRVDLDVMKKYEKALADETKGGE